MPVCRLCQKMQPSAEVSRGRCKDKTACKARVEKALSERDVVSPVGRRRTAARSRSENAVATGGRPA